MLVQVRAYVDRRVLDRFEEHLGDARLLDVDQVRLEHALGSFEALRTNFDRAAVGQLNEMAKNVIIREGDEEGLGAWHRAAVAY